MDHCRIAECITLSCYPVPAASSTAGARRGAISAPTRNTLRPTDIQVPQRINNARVLPTTAQNARRR